MRKVVVDTSVVLKWILKEPDSDKALALLTHWSNEQVEMLAPALLAYEAANILYQDVRKGKYTIEIARKSLRDVVMTGIVFDFSADLALSMHAVEFAHRFSLPASYDSHFLALAEREECELWTADSRLKRAIKGQLDWIHTLDDY
ncbi:MAG TPA: type II toxin-antitoxin system VapC family toxin [Ktedonobacteraceae bacterium]|jgi:predicted nucleic acid-binding protein|nr:type II toxin-antitoxin system VapC family toxin [Ktedonobacteraceae bacterium]